MLILVILILANIAQNSREAIHNVLLYYQKARARTLLETKTKIS